MDLYIIHTHIHTHLSDSCVCFFIFSISPLEGFCSIVWRITQRFCIFYFANCDKIINERYKKGKVVNKNNILKARPNIVRNQTFTCMMLNIKDIKVYVSKKGSIHVCNMYNTNDTHLAYMILVLMQEQKVFNFKGRLLFFFF